MQTWKARGCVNQAEPWGRMNEDSNSGFGVPHPGDLTERAGLSGLETPLRGEWRSLLWPILRGARVHCRMVSCLVRSTYTLHSEVQMYPCEEAGGKDLCFFQRAFLGDLCCCLSHFFSSTKWTEWIL